MLQQQQLTAAARLTPTSAHITTLALNGRSVGTPSCLPKICCCSAPSDECRSSLQVRPPGSVRLTVCSFEHVAGNGTFVNVVATSGASRSVSRITMTSDALQSLGLVSSSHVTLFSDGCQVSCEFCRALLFARPARVGNKSGEQSLTKHRVSMDDLKCLQEHPSI